MEDDGKPAFLIIVVDDFTVSAPDNDNDVDVVLNDNADDAFLDVLMTEPASKRSLLSSRSTDAKPSETPVADDVSPSSARSAKSNKKMKREL